MKRYKKLSHSFKVIDLPKKHVDAGGREAYYNGIL